MSPHLMSFAPLAVLFFLDTGCGGDARTTDKKVPSASATSDAKPGKQMDACSVLTPAEIETVTGAKAVAPKAEAHGTAGTCNYYEGEQLMPVVSVVIAPGMPKM